MNFSQDMSHVVGKNRKELLAMAKGHGEDKKGYSDIHLMLWAMLAIKLAKGHPVMGLEDISWMNYDFCQNGKGVLIRSPYLETLC